MTFSIFSTLPSNFNLLSKIIPKNLYFSTLSTTSPSIVTDETAGGCFLKSISNSFFLVTFVLLRSKKLSLHHAVNLSTSFICAIEFDKSTIAALSVYSIKIVFSVPVQSFVYNVKRTGDKTHPCGIPVEMDRSPDNTPWN